MVGVSRFFSCCHNYSKGRSGSVFFLAGIIIVREGLGPFFSCCHIYSKGRYGSVFFGLP